jgi:class 3 adenylate cyclase
VAGVRKTVTDVFCDVQQFVGDAVMTGFEVPVPHEDDLGRVR